MVETIGLAGDAAAGATTVAACAAFVPGRSSAASLTFGLLVGARELCTAAAGARPTWSPPAIAVVAAAAEARGLRIAPQIRRQLPEHWRWTMPLPMAACLYGILLGLGLHHLRAQLRRLGAGRDQPRARGPGAGLVIGAAFGIGRAIPIVAGRAGGRPPVRQALHRARWPSARRSTGSSDSGTQRRSESLRRRWRPRHGDRRANRGDERRRSVGGGQGDRVSERGTGRASFAPAARPTACRGTTRRLGGPLAAVIRRRPDQDPEPLQAERPDLALRPARGGPRDLARLAHLLEPQPRAHRADGEADHGHAAIRATSSGSRLSTRQPPSAIRASTEGRVVFTVSGRRSNSIRLVRLNSGRNGRC